MAKAKATQYRGGWAVRWRTLDGKQRLKRCPSKRTAEQLASTLNHHLSLGQAWDPDTAGSAPAPPVSIWQVVEDYTEHRVANLSPSTQRNTVRCLNTFLDFLEEETADRWFEYSDGSAPPVTLLSRPLLADFWAWLARNTQTQPHTRAQYVRAIQVAWVWAEDKVERYGEGRIPRPRTLELPKVPAPDPVAPTYADWALMIAELETVSTRFEFRSRAAGASPGWTVDLALWLYYTGMRRSAALEATWDMVDLPAKLLHIPADVTKGKYGARTIPLHPDLARRLAGWGKREGHIIGAPAGERVLGKSFVGKRLRRAWVRSGVAEAKWRNRPVHCCRHMIETEWASAGIPDAVIDGFLGHKPRGTGGRHYREKARLKPLMESAVVAMPPIVLAGEVGGLVALPTAAQKQ